MSLSFNLLFLAYFFNEKRLLSTLALGIGLLMHPLTSLPFLLFFYLELFFFHNRKRFFHSSLFSGTIPIIFLVFFVLSTQLSGLKFFALIDPFWESIIKYRDPYVFIASWDWRHYRPLFLIISVGFFAVGRLELGGLFENSVKRKHLYLLLLISLLLFVVSFITVDVVNYKVKETHHYKTKLTHLA